VDKYPKTKTELEKLIADKIEESFNLEYKGADALQNTDGKKKEIAKDVSSFANSAGGVIIYGIKEFDELEKRHLPERITPLNRTQISKEWLEQVINSNISPKIENLIIYPVILDVVDEVVYIVEIPKSNTAHQNTSDKRYYRRYNFEAVSMLDYEIRDIMNRTKHPSIEMGFLIEKRIFKKKENSFFPKLHSPTNLLDMMKEEISKLPEYKTEFKLKIFPVNKGSIYVMYINYYVKLPVNILSNIEHGSFNKINDDYVEYYGENTYRDVVDVQGSSYTGYFSKYGPSRFDPVLPGLNGRSEKLKLKDEPILDDREISWTVYADNSQPKSGKIKLTEIPLIEKDERVGTDE
jgi:hypothetical protein